MIDCSKTENYFAEKRRMTKKNKLNGGAYICELNCTDCPLSSLNNDTSDKMPCSDFETIYPEKAIEIVQEWSDEHQKKTYLSEFLKHYPNALVLNNNIPRAFCPHSLGLKDIKSCQGKGFSDERCLECWNQTVEESESK